MGSILTIDTGGTKTRMVQFDGSSDPADANNATIESEVEIKTPHNQQDYIDMVTSTIFDNFPEFRDFSDDNVVVLATRGLVDNGIVTSTSINWHDFPIEKLMSQSLRGVKVISGNDAKIGALGAFAGSNTNRGLYITIGTGIGGGMMVDGKLSDDLINMEIGKIAFYQDASSATWESMASGSAFFKKYARYGNDIEIDDPIWTEFADSIAKGIIALLPVLYPNEIIIGGSMAEFFPKYGFHLSRIVSEKAWQPYSDIKISAAKDHRHTVNKGALIVALQSMRAIHED